MNDGMELKLSGRGLLEVIAQKLPGGTEENHNKIQ
jgi:hypothetical protein